MKGKRAGEGGTPGRDVPGRQEARVIHVDGYVGDVRGVGASRHPSDAPGKCRIMK